MRVSSTNLKTHLGKHLRAVRAGRELIVTDRDQPIAKLVPYTEAAEPPVLEVAQAPHPAASSLGAVELVSLDRPGISGTQLLMDDRRRR